MPKAEDLKRKIIVLIDENRNVWAKQAFYSDPEVASILDNIYERWEKEGRKGIPIDYATYDELLILAGKAERYRNAGPGDVLSGMLLESATGSYAIREEKKENAIIRLIKRIFYLR